MLKPICSYKKFSSYAEICNQIEIPKIQRNIIDHQIENMKTFVKDCIGNKTEPIFGCLDLVKVETYPLMYIVDGQHRLSVIQDFFKQGIHIPIHTMIYSVSTHDEMIDIFRYRNLGIPVPSYLLEAKDDIEGKTQLIKDISTYLEKEVKTFRYKSCNRPYVSIVNFLDCFTKSKLYTIVSSVEDFVKILHLINTECYQNVEALDEKGKKKLGITPNMMKVWNEAGIYIGYNTNYPYFNPDIDISKYMNLIN
jgi:hypothetical protein